MWQHISPSVVSCSVKLSRLSDLRSSLNEWNRVAAWKATLPPFLFRSFFIRSMISTRGSLWLLLRPFWLDSVNARSPALSFEFSDPPPGLTFSGTWTALQPLPYISGTWCFLWKHQWKGLVLNWTWGNESGVVWQERGIREPLENLEWIFPLLTLFNINNKCGGGKKRKGKEEHRTERRKKREKTKDNQKLYFL